MDANSKDVSRIMNIAGAADDKSAIEMSRIVKGKPYPSDQSLVAVSDPRVEARNGDLVRIVTVCRPRPVPANREAKQARQPAAV